MFQICPFRIHAQHGAAVLHNGQKSRGGIDKSKQAAVLDRNRKIETDTVHSAFLADTVPFLR